MKTKLLLLLLFTVFNWTFAQKKLSDSVTLLNPSYHSPASAKAEVKNNITVDPNKIYVEVEQLAEFPGGLTAFRKKLNNAFDQSKIVNKGIYKAEVTFVIHQSGKLLDIKSKGNSKEFNEEVVRSIQSISNKWSPSKINGQAVQYLFRFPVAMQF